MGPTTQQLENQIESTREDLGANLHELERRVKEIGDWRHHFDNHPTALLGAALGGGFVLALMVGGRRRRPYANTTLQLKAPVTHLPQRGSETWENIKGALIGVAAARATTFVEKVVPGFAEQFRKMTS
jgi:hypothetical protein